MGDFGILGGAAGKSGASYGLKMNLSKITADPFVCPSQIFFSSDHYESASKTEVRPKQKCLKGIFPYEEAFRCLLFCRVTSLRWHIYRTFCTYYYHQTHNCVKLIFIIVSNFDLVHNRENPMERRLPFSILFVKVIRGVCPEDSNSCTVYLMLFNQAGTLFLHIICVLCGCPLNCLCADVLHTS